MLEAVDSEWALREATLAERGHSPTYRVCVETGDGSREYVLKAAPEGGDGGVATEARLLAVLDERTAIPVPTVVGAVDDHPELPTPFFLAERIEGAELSFEETRGLSDRVLRRLARRTGAHLGELHALDVVDSFGRVTHGTEHLDGNRPSGDVRRLAVRDRTDSWADALRAMVERELDALAATRFADLAPRLRPWFRERVDGLDGPFSPVLGRIDHGVHNLLVERDAGEVRAVLDWGFALAVPAGYDLQCVEYVLSGAVLSTLPDVPDRRELVRAALLAGYRSTVATVGGNDAPSNPDTHAPYDRDNHALYELLAVVRAANHLDAGVAKVPAGRESAVANGLGEEVEAALERDGR